MSTFVYPHTIDNGAGERLTFLRRVSGETGDRLEVENVVAPGAGPPPMHVHHRQSEVLTVVRGRIAYQRPGQLVEYAGPGATVAFMAGDAHRFWNAGDDDLVCSGYIDPADNIEYFLGEIFASARRGGGHMPNVFDGAYLTSRYRSEFTLFDVPSLVQRLVFPVLVVIGRLLGRYARYADASEPIR